MIAAAVTITVGGATYVLATSIANNLNKQKYDHYQAYIKNGNVYLGNSLTFNTAVSRVKSSSNVWSKSSTLALSVAKSAGGGKKPVGPEIHNRGKSRTQTFYLHYHTNNRAGGHSFYGLGQPGLLY